MCDSPVRPKFDKKHVCDIHLTEFIRMRDDGGYKETRTDTASQFFKGVQRSSHVGDCMARSSGFL